MQAEVVGKVGWQPAALGKLPGQGIGEAAFFAGFVVAKGFTVGGQGDHLLLAIAPHGLPQAQGKMLRTLERIAEANVAGNRPVIEKDVDVAIAPGVALG